MHFILKCHFHTRDNSQRQLTRKSYSLFRDRCKIVRDKHKILCDANLAPCDFIFDSLPLSSLLASFTSASVIRVSEMRMSSAKKRREWDRAAWKECKETEEARECEEKRRAHSKPCNAQCKQKHGSGSDGDDTAVGWDAPSSQLMSQPNTYSLAW